MLPTPNACTSCLLLQGTNTAVVLQLLDRRCTTQGLTVTRPDHCQPLIAVVTHALRDIILS